MPYIKQEHRNYLDGYIVELATRLIGKKTHNNILCGELNYIIFKITKILTNPDIVGGEKSYARFNAIIGALECCKQEIYRRMIGPHEDSKIIENGDVI
jgi:hypothetical protein